MPRKSTSLEAIRRQIDQIDDDTHRLLVKRARLVGRVAVVKARDGGGPALRPEREAQVLRRLLKRNQGNLAPEVVARIWRELFPAMVRLQGPFEVVVCGVGNEIAAWDIARSHFGSATPMTVVRSPARALATLQRLDRKGGGAVVVLPMPGNRGDGRWWSKLAPKGERALRIIGKLPFVKTGNNASASNEAMVVGCLAWRSSGDDQTLMVVDARLRTPARQVLDWLRAAKLSGQVVATCAREGAPRHRLLLIQISGYVDNEDRRLRQFGILAAGAVNKSIVIGGFPTCFEPPEEKVI